MMLCSFRPIVDMKYPGDHTIRSFQYTFSNHANFFLSMLALRPLIRPMTSLTEYLGGMITIAWIWSTCMLISTVSTPGISLNIFGKSLLRYPLTPGFRILRRYFGIHTIWYSVRYTPCPDTLFSTHSKNTKISSSIHPRACPWNST